jgi:hypothetical protein
MLSATLSLLSGATAMPDEADEIPTSYNHLGKNVYRSSPTGE